MSSDKNVVYKTEHANGTEVETLVKLSDNHPENPGGVSRVMTFESNKSKKKA